MKKLKDYYILIILFVKLNIKRSILLGTRKISILSIKGFLNNLLIYLNCSKFFFLIERIFIIEYDFAKTPILMIEGFLNNLLIYSNCSKISFSIERIFIIEYDFTFAFVLTYHNLFYTHFAFVIILTHYKFF